MSKYALPEHENWPTGLEIDPPVAKLAKALWSVHPLDVIETGLTREEYYAQGIQKLVNDVLGENLSSLD